MSAPETPTAARAPESSGRNGLLTFNVIWGIVGLVVGYAIGLWIGHRLGSRFDWVAEIDYNDIAVLLGYSLGTVGYLAGLGILNHPIARLFGRSGGDVAKGPRGWARYARASTDHKVIGNQYLIGIGMFFFIGGVNAMLIRTELLHPNSPTFSPGQYLTIVGLHGAMMIMMVSSIILGPFGHYFVPIMIGSRRMAFPARGALVLAPAAGRRDPREHDRLRGLPHRLDRLPDARERGRRRHGRLPVRVRAGRRRHDPERAEHARHGVQPPGARHDLVAAADLRLEHGDDVGADAARAADAARRGVHAGARPHVGDDVLLGADRRSPFLWENLFWFFGHPEVYILALPGFGIVLEILPVFARKPLWGYRLAVSGMLGVTLLSFMVWQHHLFVSGINSSLRPFYMLTTELISVPTGFIFLVGIATLWRARIRYTVPMLFALAFFVNFLIGGLSGVYLSDVPSDVTLHGSFFVLAHFHYTIMGGLVFAFFAGIYYWLPKIGGRRANEVLGKIHFWTAFVFFNSTFLPLFAVGMLGMPRRTATYAPAPAVPERLGVDLGVPPRRVDARVPGELRLVARRRPGACGAQPVDGPLARWQLPTPVRPGILTTRCGSWRGRTSTATLGAAGGGAGPPVVPSAGD